MKQSLGPKLVYLTNKTRMASHNTAVPTSSPTRSASRKPSCQLAASVRGSSGVHNLYGWGHHPFSV